MASTEPCASRSVNLNCGDADRAVGDALHSTRAPPFKIDPQAPTTLSASNFHPPLHPTPIMVIMMRRHCRRPRSKPLAAALIRRWPRA
eukprot:3045230-Rhodomonas_salina.1